MKFPEYLSKGDSIALIAPARKLSEAEASPAIREIESRGFNVITAKHAFGNFRQFSGTDEERLLDLQWAFDHPEAKAIFCLRGGYGALRILDGIRMEAFMKRPKWFVGYSDMTVILSHLAQQGFAGIHGTMPVNFPKNPVGVDTLFRVLQGEKMNYEFPGHDLRRAGKSEGMVTGGNLSLLYALKGSSTFPDLKGKILFLEDLDEYLYHIDRMMVSLKRSGAFSGLAGLVVGGMTEMKDNAVPFGSTAEEIIFDAVREYDYPVAFSFPAGHIPENKALTFGARARLCVEKGSASLQFLQ